jgi:hypothetical protein
MPCTSKFGLYRNRFAASRTRPRVSFEISPCFRNTREIVVMDKCVSSAISLKLTPADFGRTILYPFLKTLLTNLYHRCITACSGYTSYNAKNKGKDCGMKRPQPFENALRALPQ